MEALKDLINIWEAKGRLGELNENEENFLMGLRTALILVTETA